MTVKKSNQDNIKNVFSVVVFHVADHSLFDGENNELCMSTQGFLLTSLLILTVLMASSITSATLWIKLQKINLYKV